MAIPPKLFGEVVTNLGKSGCADGARIIVEKTIRYGPYLSTEIKSHSFRNFPRVSDFQD